MSFLWKKKRRKSRIRARSTSQPPPPAIPLDMTKLKPTRKSSIDPTMIDRDTISSASSSSSSTTTRRRSPHPHGHGNSPKRFQPINLSSISQQQQEPFRMMDSPDGSDWVFSFIYLDGSDGDVHQSDHLYGLLWILNGSALLSMDGGYVPMRKNDCIVIPQFSSWKLAPRTAPPLVAIRAVVLTPPP